MLYLLPIAVITGLLFGSFFNVLIWRLPRDESIVWPPSHCTQCGKNIKPWENIPVLSFIFLMGKCSTCKTRISILYPLVEICTAIFAIVFALFFIKTMTIPFSWFTVIPLLIQFIFLLLMIPMTIIDLKHYIIPDQITLPFIITGLAISFLPGMTSPLSSIAGILVGGGFLYLTGWLGSVVLKKVMQWEVGILNLWLQLVLSGVPRLL